MPSPVPSSSSRFLGWIHDWNKIRMHLRQCGTKEASLAVIWTEERAAETERVNKACQACRTAWAEAPVSLGENIKCLLFPLLLSMGSCASPVNRQLSNHKSRTAFPTTWLVSLRSRCASGLLQHAWLREMHNTGVRPAQAGRMTWVRDWKHSVSFFNFFPNLHPKGTEEFYRYYIQHETHFHSVKCIWKSNVVAVQLLPSSTTAVWEGVCWVHHLLMAPWLEVNYLIRLIEVWPPNVVLYINMYVCMYAVEFKGVYVMQRFFSLFIFCFLLWHVSESYNMYVGWRSHLLQLPPWLVQVGEK